VADQRPVVEPPPARRVNDIGGDPAGPIDRSDHAALLWQRMAVATRAAIGTPAKRLVTLDEARRASEDLGLLHDRLGYFERGVRAAANVLIEKGVLGEDELARRMAEIRARPR